MRDPAQPVAETVPLAPAAPAYARWVAPSPPRADWPCAMDQLIDDRHLFEVAIEYAGPASCVLPVEVQADGIVGCPSRMVYTELRSGRATEARFFYDGAGRLRVAMLDGRTIEYDWRDGALVARRTPGGRDVYREQDGQVALTRDVDGGGTVTSVVLHVEDARLVRQEFPVRGRVTTLGWAGGRLRTSEAVEVGWTRFAKLHYECDGRVMQLPVE